MVGGEGHIVNPESNFLIGLRIATKPPYLAMLVRDILSLEDLNFSPYPISSIAPTYRRGLKKDHKKFDWVQTAIIAINKQKGNAFLHKFVVSVVCVVLFIDGLAGALHTIEKWSLAEQSNSEMSSERTTNLPPTRGIPYLHYECAIFLQILLFRIPYASKIWWVVSVEAQI